MSAFLEAIIKSLSNMEWLLLVIVLLLVWLLFRFHISDKYKNFNLADLVMHNNKLDKFAFWFSVWNGFFMWLILYLARAKLLTDTALGIIVGAAVAPLIAKVIWNKPIVSTFRESSFQRDVSAPAPPLAVPQPPPPPTGAQ